MKELAATSRNILLSQSADEQSSMPMVEAIFLLVEPKHVIGKDGKLIRKQIQESVRFHAGPATLRTVAKQFLEWADQADAFAVNCNLERKK